MTRATTHHQLIKTAAAIAGISVNDWVDRVLGGYTPSPRCQDQAQLDQMASDYVIERARVIVNMAAGDEGSWLQFRAQRVVAGNGVVS